jgi:hypothetical protein
MDDPFVGDYSGVYSGTSVGHHRLERDQGQEGAVGRITSTRITARISGSLFGILSRWPARIRGPEYALRPPQNCYPGAHGIPGTGDRGRHRTEIQTDQEKLGVALVNSPRKIILRVSTD